MCGQTHAQVITMIHAMCRRSHAQFRKHGPQSSNALCVQSQAHFESMADRPLIQFAHNLAYNSASMADRRIYNAQTISCTPPQAWPTGRYATLSQSHAQFRKHGRQAANAMCGQSHPLLCKHGQQAVNACYQARQTGHEQSHAQLFKHGRKAIHPMCGQSHTQLRKHGRQAVNAMCVQSHA